MIPNNVKDNDKVKDIAWQLINTAPGNKSKVILGGGFPAFYPRPPNVPRKPIKEVSSITILFISFVFRNVKRYENCLDFTRVSLTFFNILVQGK